MDRAAQSLRSAFDMDDHGLRLAADLRMAMSDGQRDHFVGTGDDRGHGAPLRSCFGNRFNKPGVIAAEIDEDMADVLLGKGLEKGGCGRVHQLLRRTCSLQPAPGAANRRIGETSTGRSASRHDEVHTCWT